MGADKPRESFQDLLHGRGRSLETTRENHRGPTDSDVESRSLPADRIAIAVVLLIVGLVMFRCAWVCDDAYITLRTVDNFVNGYGLRWNPAERVQSYTHPLWMFLVSGAYYATGEAYYTVIVLGLLFSFVAVAILVFGISYSTSGAIFGAVTLILSKAFIDYSTSGLENPLSHALLLCFLYVFVKKETSLKKIYVLSILAGLLSLTRLDLVLLPAPVLLCVIVDYGKCRGVVAACVGLLPLAAWETFSLLYYGAPFPNTAYAKLAGGIPKIMMMKQGICYLLNSLSNDPLTTMVITLGVVLPFTAKQRRLIPFSAGIALYVLYVAAVGGDAMSGRFLTPPFVCALGVVSAPAIGMTTSIRLTMLSAFALVGLCSPYPPILNDGTYGMAGYVVRDANGIADERAHYNRDGMGILRTTRAEQMPKHYWVAEGLSLRKEGKNVHVSGPIGIKGYYAGPKTHIIDTYALCDPLLARIPCADKRGWRIAHLTRPLPEGYFETVERGANLIRDKNLAEYYDKISLITRGPVLNGERLKEIVLMNLGRYDYLVSPDVEGATKTRTLSRFDLPKAEGSDWQAYGNAVITESAGAEIDVEGLRKSKKLEISLDHNDTYRLIYYKAGKEIGSQETSRREEPPGGLMIHTLTVPPEVVEQGFDKIVVVPTFGDGCYSIGHLRLIDSD